MPTYTFTMPDTGLLPIGIKETLARVFPSFAGKKIRLSVEEAKEKSSQSQREYYFAVIVPAWMDILKNAQDEYWTDKETHAHLMEEVGGWFLPLKKGQKRPLRKSYMDLTTAEAEAHHALCRKAAADEYVDIPEPNEQSKIWNSV